MSNALPSADSCVNQCTSPVVVDIPGSPGAPGANGTNGTNGVNAFTTLSSGFTMPAELANVTISVAVSSWMVIGQLIFVQSAGWFQVVLLPTTTSATIKNLKDTGSSAYLTNVAPGTAVGSGGTVSPGGLQGPQGATGGGGDMLRANNLSDVVSIPTSLSNLGATVIGKQFFSLASPGALRFVNISAGNTVQERTAAQFIADLALTIGTNVEAWSAILDGLAAIAGAAADKLPYFTGATAMATTNLTSVARSFLAQSSISDELVQLGRVKTRYGLLGSLSAVNVNAGATDNPCPISASRYKPDLITVDNPVGVTNITTATLGVFVGAGGGGGTVAADQALSPITTGTKFLDMVISGVATTDILTGANLQVRCGTPQGAACVVDVHIFGFDLSP